MGKVKSGLLPWSGPIELFHEALSRKQRHSQEFGDKKSSKKRSSKGSSSLSSSSSSSSSSFWGNWTSVLRHQLNRRYHCVFSLHIHSVRNLPRSADGLLVEVHCIRKSRSCTTLQSRCSGGVVEFEETLHLRSRVRATRGFPHTIKHPVSKSVRLLVVSPGSRVPVLGEVDLDLGSTLPAAIADTIDYASRTAWTSAFRVSSPTGVIKGASLVASIGYEFLDPEGLKPQASGSRSGSSLWRRMRPLSSIIVSSSSNVSFARSESMRSMPDLGGLAREAYDSDEGIEDEEEPDGDENRPPSSDCLDLALCSLVHAQMERTDNERDQQPSTMRKSFEVRTDEHGNSEDGEFEPLVLEVLVPVHRPQHGADDDGSEDAVMDSIEQEKLALFMNKNREEELAVDDGGMDEEEIALQFLKMLKDEPMLPLVRTTGGEALGAPVYEANNWLLSSIPEEEASEDEEEPTATTITTTTMATICSSSASSSVRTPNVEPEVDSAELHAFMPLWRREDDLELESIMQAAEAELQKAMKL